MYFEVFAAAALCVCAPLCERARKKERFQRFCMIDCGAKSTRRMYTYVRLGPIATRRKKRPIALAHSALSHREAN
jgi:hypothetical protein